MALGIEQLLVGVYTDVGNQTGCTVLLPPVGTVGGVAIRGGAPGTREAAALGPQGTVTVCHGVMLCGSSLFGLAAAEGVVDWCVANDRGLALPAGRFPIVGAAVVMDQRKPGTRRIDRDSGRTACDSATAADPAMGSIGVGTGCTVGKEAGPTWSSKGGQGWAVERAGPLVVSALMAVNAVGTVYRPDGVVLAGCRAPGHIPRFPRVSNDLLSSGPTVGAREHDEAGSFSNTVIGCIVTNATLDKPSACRVADLGHSGTARSISPAHTSLDGDALFALATGEVEAHLDLVAHLAARAVERAVRAGVQAAAALPGLPVDPRAAQWREPPRMV
jgi:L-aminopeptidase/D-esterase-like protein